MPTTATPNKDEAQIRERLNAWTRALHAKDLDALMALYAPDVITFDLMPPHQVPLTTGARDGGFPEEKRPVADDP